jgi:hypothetical protein
MGIWEYGNMGIWEYGNMGIWEFSKAKTTINPTSPEKANYLVWAVYIP